MDKETLQFTVEKISEAQRPEEVFGDLGSGDRLIAAGLVYRRLSKVVHPNAYVIGSPEQVTAEEAFKKLSQLMEDAKRRLSDGTYGQIETAIIKTRRREYKIFKSLPHTDFCNAYFSTYNEGGVDIPVHFKMARNSRDNDLVSNEARVLRKLREGENYDKYSAYFPSLIDSFTYIDKEDPMPKQVNVFAASNDEFHSLKEVKDYYHDGIDPKDMAWIWRRMLVYLGFAHSNGIIHGAVLPQNIFIQAEQHGLIATEWSYAVLDPDTSGERISAINSDYEDWYPSEIKRKDMPTPALDIYMGAKCMEYLLPDSADRGLSEFLKRCQLERPRQRPQDAWELLQEFDQLIESLWGPRKFHHFSMPKKAERR